MPYSAIARKEDTTAFPSDPMVGVCLNGGPDAGAQLFDRNLNNSAERHELCLRLYVILNQRACVVFTQSPGVVASHKTTEWFRLSVHHDRLTKRRLHLLSPIKGIQGRAPPPLVVALGRPLFIRAGIGG